MPTYQYACTECEHDFEQFQSFSDDTLTVCPQCQGRLRKVYNAVGVVFKGSGFYRNDSRPAEGTKKGGSSESGSDKSGSDTSGSDTSGSEKSGSGKTGTEKSGSSEKSGAAASSGSAEKSGSKGTSAA